MSITLFLILIITIRFVYHKLTTPTILEIGVFTGSNWGVQAEDSFYLIDKAIEKFEKENPLVKCHYYSGVRIEDYSENLAQQLIKGEGPDLFLVLEKDFTILSAHGLLKSLDNSSNSFKYNKDAYYSSTLESGKYKGIQYALPFECDMTVMGYNETLLENAGISIPQLNWTHQEFYDICSLVTKDNNNDGVLDTIGQCEYSWKDASLANGVNIFDSDHYKELTEPAFIESVKYMQRLNLLSKKQNVTAKDFEQGNVAFYPISFAKYRAYTSYPYTVNKELDFNWRFTSMPSLSKGDNLGSLECVLMAINGDTKHPTLAYKFLLMCTEDPEIQLLIYSNSQGASALKEVTENPLASLLLQEKLAQGEKKYDGNIISQVLDLTTPHKRNINYDQMFALIDNGVNSIIDEQKNTDIALKSLYRSIEKILN